MRGTWGVENHEHAWSDTSIEKLSGLRPSVDPRGTITVGNASGIDDGAASVAPSFERPRGREIPCAELQDVVGVGIDPMDMGVAPVRVIRRLLEGTGVDITNIDLWESDEALWIKHQWFSKRVDWRLREPTQTGVRSRWDIR